jgi:hypothetical protein
MRRSRNREKGDINNHHKKSNLNYRNISAFFMYVKYLNTVISIDRLVITGDPALCIKFKKFKKRHLLSTTKTRNSFRITRFSPSGGRGAHPTPCTDLCANGAPPFCDQ